MTDIERLFWEAADLMIRRELGQHPGIDCESRLEELSVHPHAEFMQMTNTAFNDAMTTGENPSSVVPPDPKLE
jgi:hypothetical protein